LRRYHEQFEGGNKPYSLEELDQIAARHLYTYNRITSVSPELVINLSGCNTGASDICLSWLLRRDGVKYISYDTDSFYSRKAAEFLSGGEMIRKNFDLNMSVDANLEYLVPLCLGRRYVILFTEIIEHLDLSTFHRTLAAIKELPGPYYFYLTTPNLSHWTNIIKLLIGRTIFDGAGKQFFETSNYGHVHLFTAWQLKEILESHGLYGEHRHFSWPSIGSQKTCKASRLSGRNIEVIVQVPS
jgi:hypothetical protein